MKGPTPDSFRANAEHALQDATLQHALGRAQSGFVAKRAHAIAMVLQPVHGHAVVFKLPPMVSG